MGEWSRAEIEGAFADYQQRAADAGRTGDWSTWADQFTEDADYVEHHYGTMRGREAIREWIVKVMGRWPGKDMPEAPIEWHIVDDERGWVVCQVWNRMRDPGDGSVHQAYNFTLLKYAGGGRWAYEEDIYNPAHFATMLGEWSEARQRAETAGAAESGQPARGATP